MQYRYEPKRGDVVWDSMGNGRLRRIEVLAFGWPNVHCFVDPPFPGRFREDVINIGIFSIWSGGLFGGPSGKSKLARR